MCDRLANSIDQQLASCVVTGIAAAAAIFVVAMDVTAASITAHSTWRQSCHGSLVISID